MVGTWLGLQFSKPDDKHVNANGEFQRVQKFSKKLLTFRSCSFIFFHVSDDYLDNLPDPEIVARAAAEAAAPRVLEDYIDAIETLRDKKFTFREIAEWLGQQFGIHADHNSVWRAYTKHMNDVDAHEEAQADEELEREEAIAEVEANGTLRVLSHAPVPATEATVAEKAGTENPKTTAPKAKRKKK